MKYSTRNHTAAFRRIAKGMCGPLAAAAVFALAAHLAAAPAHAAVFPYGDSEFARQEQMRYRAREAAREQYYEAEKDRRSSDWGRMMADPYYEAPDNYCTGEGDWDC